MGRATTKNQEKLCNMNLNTNHGGRTRIPRVYSENWTGENNTTYETALYRLRDLKSNIAILKKKTLY